MNTQGNEASKPPVVFQTSEQFAEVYGQDCLDALRSSTAPWKMTESGWVYKAEREDH